MFQPIKIAQLGIGHNHGDATMDTLRRFPEYFEVMGVAEDDPVKIEFTIKKLLPPAQTLDFCHRLVMHGRARCMARRPDCEMCEIAGLCKKVGVVSK